MADPIPSPLVTIVMPVRNEAAFIEQSLASLLTQDYPMSRVEVLVVDGMSTDGTREIVEDLIGTWGQGLGVRGRGSERNPAFGTDRPSQDAHRQSIRPLPEVPSLGGLGDLGGSSPVCGSIRLLDNPGRIVPKALNIAIREARGRWLIRLDAHSVYPPDYLRKCIETAERTGADNVGGVCVTLPGVDTFGARLVQALSTSSFGVGGARFRVGGHEGPADTVAFGCFRREVFDEVGLFDERLIRNQDYEFNCRLARAGKRVWLNPAIQAKYYNQGTIAGLLGQAAFTGKWNPWMWYVAPYSFSYRHSIPVAAIIAGISAAAMSFASYVGRIFFASLLLLYVVEIGRAHV